MERRRIILPAGRRLRLITAREEPPGTPSIPLLVSVHPRQVVTSRDGINWTQGPDIPGASDAASILAGLVWAKELGLFVTRWAITDGVATSPDGVTWTQGTIPSGSQPRLGWNGTQLVATGSALNVEFRVSTDAISWSPVNVTGALTFFGVGWSPSLALWAAVGSSLIYTSPDGLVWTNRTGAITAALRTVIWSPDWGTYIAVGDSADPNIAISADGVTWTAKNSGNAAGCYAVAANANIIVGCSRSSRTTTTSVDGGVTWTPNANALPVGATGVRSLVWVPGLRLFVGTGLAGSLVYSPDGLVWSAGVGPNIAFLALAFRP